MQEIIDVPSNVQEFAIALSEAGVKTVIRYYNRSNSSRLPTKCLTRPELDALHSAGLSVAVVFEQGGGANGSLHAGCGYLFDGKIPGKIAPRAVRG